MTVEALTQELNSFTEDTVSLIRHDGVEQVWLYQTSVKFQL